MLSEHEHDQCIENALEHTTRTNLLFLNVNGLRSKTTLPEFLNEIQNYDILAFVESKTDDYDNFNLPNFNTFYVKNRHKNKRIRSGGIFVALSERVSERFEFDNKIGNETTLWLKENIPNAKHKILLDDYKVRPELNKHKNI